MNIYLITLFLYLIFIIIELYPSFINKKYGEIAVYMLLSSIPIFILILFILRINFPSPSEKIKNIVLYILGKF